MTQYGYSKRHDAALSLCIASGKVCPTGCVKDGAPNCNAHVVGNFGIQQCEFGRQTAHLTRLAPDKWESADFTSLVQPLSLSTS